MKLLRCTAILVLAAALATGQPATSPPTILEVDYENLVEYQSDTSDLSKLATVPSPVPAVPPKNFFYALSVGDIVAVNGQRAKGTIAAQAWSIGLSPTANPGDAIADIQRASLRYQTFEILKPNGTPIGTIVALGPNGGPPPPGAPLAQSGGEFGDCRGHWSVSRRTRPIRRGAASTKYSKPFCINSGRSSQPAPKRRWEAKIHSSPDPNVKTRGYYNWRGTGNHSL